MLEASSPSDRPDYGPTGTGGGILTPVEVGMVAQRDRYRVIFTCAGPTPIRYTFGGLMDQLIPPASLPADHSTTEVECDGAVHEDDLDLPLVDGARFLVTSDSRSAWRLMVTTAPPPIALAPNEGGWTISGGAGPNYMTDRQPGGVSLPGANGGGDVRVVIACSGDTTLTGTIDVGPVVGQQLDPFTVGCAGSDAAGIARIYPKAASYVEVQYDPRGAPIWLAITVQVRAPASPPP